MALSGSTPKVYTDKGAFWTWIEWTATQNIANNTSTVTANLYLGTNAYGYISYAGGSPNIVLDGTTKTLSPITINTNTTKKLVGSYTKTITHNSDGKKSFSLGGRYHHSSTSLTITLNIPTTYPTLDTIPRYAKITSFTVSDVRIDRATINYSTDKAVTDVRYAIWNTNGTVFRQWTSASNGFAITGLAPNTSYDIGIRVTNTASGLTTYSAKRRITTVRLSTGTIVNRNVHAGNPIILNISRANSNITHNVTMQVGTDQNTYMNLKTVNGVGTSVDLTLSSAERDLFYQNRKLGKASNYRVLIKSIWGGEKGSVYSNAAVLTMTDNEIIPTLSGVTYKDTNTIVQNIIGNDQKILRNISTVRFNAGTASPQKWASIKSYTVTFNGNTFTKNSSTTTGEYIDTGKVDATKATTATLTVRDSRGFTASRSITVDILDYVAPQFIDNKAVRTNNYEEDSYLVTQNRRSIVKINDIDLNFFSLRYRLKNTNSETYGAWTTVATTNTNTQGLYQNVTTNEFINDFPNDQSYNIQVQIKDRFTDWQTITILLSEGIALMQFYKDRATLGVPLYDKKTNGKYATEGFVNMGLEPFKTHMAEIVSQLSTISISDSSLINTGVETILPGFARKPKRITVMAVLSNRAAMSLGDISSSQAHIYATGATGKIVFGDSNNTLITLMSDTNPSDFIRGVGTITANNELKISWTKYGAGVIGILRIKATATFHGED